MLIAYLFVGYSDPIYAEAFVKMHGFDIMLGMANCLIYLCSHLLSMFLDVLLVNQTANTLQNLCLDFATLGDLKIVERPAVHTVPPYGYQSIKATIKVSLVLSVFEGKQPMLCVGLVDGNRCHLWQHPMGRTEHERSLCRAARYPCRYHGLHQAVVCQRGAGMSSHVSVKPSF